jgi:membrane fusion protein (multidrug efflux system)
MAEETRRKSVVLRIMVAVAVLLLMAGGAFGYWYHFMRGVVYSDDARFGGHLVDLAPELAGTLQEVQVREGERVRMGQALFRLNPAVPVAVLAQREAARKSAEAQIAVAQARYERALHGYLPEEIRVAEATLKRSAAERELAQLEFQRADELRQKGVVAQEQLDRAKTACSVADHAYAQSAESLALLQRGTREEDVAAAKSQVEAAEGALKEAEEAVARAKLDVERSTIVAPFDGLVARRWLDPGAMVQPGQPVLTVFDPSTLRVDANIEERFLCRVAIGDEVDISVDAYPSLHLKGHVQDILQATNSKFSLIPAEGVAGTYIKVTQRVPLRIAVDLPTDLCIGPGFSVEVRIREGSAARLSAQVASQ